ncbi:M23 family metallopeptidase [Bacillus sp. FJAT-42376]|uniref:M23 family metallopeptidase n=1 Tax=Bacillus sp. FJAT-42376 TaxID=2014076 RepID=UPI000F50ADDD|nr:M23 family metallopeptidase [Bacillus sp. FJAT-42376]AZB43786.1 M23 family metallopeptidase [Bacillus sp. FJAT-42376]
MSRRADEIRKRMAKKKKSRPLSGKADLPVVWEKEAVMEEEEKYTGIIRSYEGGPETLKDTGHPLIRPDVFLLKLFLSATLVLGMAVVFKEQSPKLDAIRTAAKASLEHEFQFAAVSSWYQKQFGHPLALFQTDMLSAGKAPLKGEYAVPASGKVTENFKANGQGVLVETDRPTVEAIDEGVVLEAGEKPDTGLTIVVQHADGSESWYGNLESADVALYDTVVTGKELGTIKVNENKKGTYYFAIKKGDNFIDPIQVISFD